MYHMYQWEVMSFLTLAFHFIINTFTTSKEEKDMGISQEATQDYRDTYQIPGTDGIEEIKKRGRAESSISTISTQPHRKNARS
jgi:hypothetical protein